MSTTATAMPANPPVAPAPRMPPGPPLPRLIQTALLTVVGQPYLEWLNRRYGDAATIRTLFLPEPDGRRLRSGLTRELFQGPHDQLHAGEANALLGPLLGERSVLVLDGAERMRQRKLLLPPFHGRAAPLRAGNPGGHGR